MSQKRKDKEIPFWAKLGHAKPVTRRDFLATGVIPFAAYAVGPSLATLLSPSKVYGAECNASSSSASYIPFITLNLSGGPSLASQLIVKDLGGNNLPSYTKLGLGSGPGRSLNPAVEFGKVEFAGTAIGGQTQGLVSKFLMGVRDPRNANARNPALDKTAFVWSAVALGDDTSNNKLDVTGLVLKMGLSGTKLPNLGRTDTATGIGQQPTMFPPNSPFVVGNVDDLVNALGYKAALAGLNTSQKASLARVIASMTSSQAQRMASMHGGQAVTQVAECAGVRNVDLVASGGGDINPFAVGGAVSTELARIWGIQVTDKASQNAVFGAMVYNGLVGNAATVNLNMGGYDYHDGTRTSGDTRDQQAGAVIGKILESAHYLQKPVFIYVTGDGATVSTEGLTADTPWTSDRGIAGMQYILAYHPSGRPETSSSQIGGFNNGQAADGNFFTGNNPELAAQAVFANYAAWNGRMDFVEQNRVIGDQVAQVIRLPKAPKA